MTTKLDKNELNEPDKLQLFFLSLQTFVNTHKTRIMMTTGFFILVFVLASGWYLYQRHNESSAQKMFFAIADAHMKAGSPASDEVAITGFKEVIAKYPRSQASLSARYKLANLYAVRKEWDFAIATYQDYLSQADSGNELMSLAYNGLGACFEAKKEYDKALNQFEKALHANGASSFESLHFGSIARVHEEMNNNTKAVEFYKKALEKTSDPMMTLYLKRKIALLG